MSVQRISNTQKYFQDNWNKKKNPKDIKKNQKDINKNPANDKVLDSKKLFKQKFLSDILALKHCSQKIFSKHNKILNQKSTKKLIKPEKIHQHDKISKSRLAKNPENWKINNDCISKKSNLNYRRRSLEVIAVSPIISNNDISLFDTSIFFKWK